MDEILAFAHMNIELIRLSVRDPVFLICVLLAVFVALAHNWIVGVLITTLIALVRAAVIDWEHFSPGVPPSPGLVFVFSATLIAGLIVLMCVKLFRVLYRVSGRMALR